MPDYKWRTPTKILAIVDMVLSGLSLIFTVLFCVLAIAGASYVLDQAEKDLKDDPRFQDENKDNLKNVWGIVVIVFLVIAVIIEVICLVAAKRLLNSTQEGISPSEAAKNSRCWRYINIFFVVVCLLGLLGGGQKSQIGSLLFNVVFRGLGLVIVSLYIKELAEAESAGPQVYYDVGQNQA